MSDDHPGEANGPLTPQGLYVVATPIGNLADISSRARDILDRVSLIAAEDTRHSRKLMNQYDIRTPLVSFHEHSGSDKLGLLLSRLQAGESVALVSDAGTPLVSDPGFRLVRQVREAGIRVIPVPGPCALTAALSAAGMPSDRFTFEGFLPARSTARDTMLNGLAGEVRTMAFYEAPHRVLETLRAMSRIFGEDRPAALARELTKAFETIIDGSLASLCRVVEEDSHQQRGEIVLLVQGVPKGESELDAEAVRILGILTSELPPAQSAALAAKITGVRKKPLYQAALEMDKGSGPDGA